MIESLLDNDVYKFHMGAFFWHYYKGLPVKYEYKCRDPKINLLCIYDELIKGIEEISKIPLQRDEQKWLYENTKVTQDYLTNFLRHFYLNSDQVFIEKTSYNPGIKITIKGPIEEASLWEMPLMSLISEIYFKKINGIEYDTIIKKAKQDLRKRIDTFITECAFNNFSFSEFGTRRRLSFEIQDDAICFLKEAMPKELLGTSNMYFARKHNLKAVGTQAHEAFMLYQALVHPEDSQRKFLQDWIDFYRGWLGICLTDTLGPKKWDRDFTKDLMILYNGQRHDSGDPYNWARERINAYKREGIDPKEKTLLFSDNLTFYKALDLTKTFCSETNVTHGIGTHITNFIPSIPEHKALNQVIKIVEADGRPVAKLGDDPMKTQCKNEIFLNYIKDISK